MVENTSVHDDMKAERLQALRGRLNAFHEKEGRRPNNLEELEERGYASGIPVHPDSDAAGRYDPASGDIE